MSSRPDRREFHKLTAAALGGLMAGGLVGCGKSDPKKTDAAGKDKDKGKEVAENPLLSEPHACKGLNTCKGKGMGGENMCAGQGACATAKKHECKGMNECKGQGGCGEKVSQNACKGMGECAVPLKAETWKKARAKFEELMKQKGKEVGPAPM